MLERQRLRDINLLFTDCVTEQNRKQLAAKKVSRKITHEIMSIVRGKRHSLKKVTRSHPFEEAHIHETLSASMISLLSERIQAERRFCDSREHFCYDCYSNLIIRRYKFEL